MNRYLPKIILTLMFLGWTLLLWVLYKPSIQFEFVWDDFYLIAENRQLLSRSFTDSFTRDFLNIDDAHFDPFRKFYRPLVTLSYKLDAMFFGLEPSGFHISNLVLHMMNCMLLGALLHRLLPGAPWVVFLAVSVFAVHPVHVENVSWISGRTDLLCAFFLLFSSHSLMSFMSRNSKVQCLMCFIFYMLALLSKEMAVSYPLLVLLAFYYSDRQGVSRSKYMILGLAVCTGIYIWMRLQIFQPDLMPTSIQSLIFTIPYALIKYMGLLFCMEFPDPHHSDTMVNSLFSREFLGSLMIHVMLIGGMIYSRSRRLLFLFGLFFILLLPVLLNIGKFGDVILADRFMYIPSMTLCGMICLIYVYLKSRNYLQIPILTLGLIFIAVSYITILAVMTYRYEFVWKNEIELFHYALRKSSDSPYIQNRMGMALVRYGLYMNAVPHFLKAKQTEPSYFQAMINLGVCYKKNGDFNNAVKELKAVSGNKMATPSQKYLAHYNLTLIFGELGALNLAYAHLRAAHRLSANASLVDKLEVWLQRMAYPKYLDRQA